MIIFELMIVLPNQKSWFYFSANGFAFMADCSLNLHLRLLFLLALFDLPIVSLLSLILGFLLSYGSW